MRVALATDSTITSALAMLTTSQVSHGVTHYRHLGLSLHKIDTQRSLLASLTHKAPNGRLIRRRRNLERGTRRILSDRPGVRPQFRTADLESPLPGEAT